MSFLSRLEQQFRDPVIYWPAVALIAASTPMAFAPYYHFWLMPLLFGALIRLAELNPQRSVAGAYVFGFIAYACQFYWIHTALHDVSGLPNLYAVPAVLLFAAFLALYPMLAFKLWRKFNLPRWMNVGIALPLLWTLTEFARERLLTGFGWGAIGYSQITRDSPLAGFAPLGGIHLVTLATAFAGAWLVLFIDNESRLKKRIAPLCAVVALFIGGYVAQQTDFTRPDGSTSTVALAQGNIEQTLKWREDQIVPTIQRYYDQVSKTRADIVILPEAAIPQIMQDLPENVLRSFAEQAQSNGSSLAVGILKYTDDSRTDYENAVVNLSEYTNGEKPRIQSYAKSHLVPFGEYKPLRFITGPLYRLMDMPMSDMKKGAAGQPPLTMKNQKVAFNICYEDGFGDELIASAKQSTLLANVSNMGWYGDSNAMWQQLQQSQARAMELGRYMVRSTNNGATAILSPKGHIVAQSVPNTVTVLEGHIKGYTGETPYMEMGGSYPLIGLLALFAVMLYYVGRNNRRFGKSAQQRPTDGTSEPAAMSQWGDDDGLQADMDQEYLIEKDK
ncbi:apolipoprotein N-acyltransferase [Neisseria sp.]|uniref:apolipoprotein N-acyltransferase n=1 Tax=Neisseria sp. TaxID=192066 RepID=UPI00359F72C1